MLCFGFGVAVSGVGCSRRWRGEDDGSRWLRRRRSIGEAGAGRWTSSLSEPFLQPSNGFDLPRVTVISPQAFDVLERVGLRVESPDLIGLVTWSVALYLGFSQKERMGRVLQRQMREWFEATGLPKGVADTLATGLHTFPFILAAFLIAGVFRASLGNSFAVSGGVFLSLWSGVYELGRPKAKTEEERDLEGQAWKDFLAFADKRLERRGRCHFLEVATAFRRQYPRYRSERDFSDEALRRFLRVWAPSAQRSPNGFYKDLSIRSVPDIF